jgi:hypothetical protein
MKNKNTITQREHPEYGTFSKSRLTKADRNRIKEPFDDTVADAVFAVCINSGIVNPDDLLPEAHGRMVGKGLITSPTP